MNRHPSPDLRIRRRQSRGFGSGAIACCQDGAGRARCSGGATCRFPRTAGRPDPAEAALRFEPAPRLNGFESSDVASCMFSCLSERTSAPRPFHRAPHHLAGSGSVFQLQGSSSLSPELVGRSGSSPVQTERLDSRMLGNTNLWAASGVPGCKSPVLAKMSRGSARCDPASFDTLIAASAGPLDGFGLDQFQEHRRTFWRTRSTPSSTRIRSS